MSDKRVNFGQKAPSQPLPDPSEFIHGLRSADSPPSTSEASGKQDKAPIPREAKVRITVDVPKSVHRRLQTICQDGETKLGPYIRELIEKDLKKKQNSQ